MSKTTYTVYKCDRCGKKEEFTVDNINLTGWEEINIPCIVVSIREGYTVERKENHTKLLCGECAKEHFDLITKWFERQKL
jgi:hypothetical protein